MNPEVFFLVFLCVLVVTALRFYLGGRRSELKFRTEANPNFVFRERGASGHSKRSIITSLGGATRALDVAVTENELWIRGILPMFTFIGEQFDLSHKVPIGNIKRAVRDGNNVELWFQGEKGQETHVLLVLQNPGAFVSAILPQSALDRTGEV